MAKFNPDVNTSNDPNYLGYSRPIEQPREFKVADAGSFNVSDTSTGVLLEGIGKTISAAAEGLDSYIKKDISDTAYTQIDKEREDFTTRLQNIDSVVDKNNKSVGVTVGDTVTLSGKSKNGSLLPDEESTDETPPQVEDLSNNLTTLQDSFNNGKISSTYYWARLNAISKNLRNTYPGYRSYIDQTVSRIAGGTPANEYIKHLAQDINSYTSKKDTEKNAVLKMLRDNVGIPGALQMYQGVVNGEKTTIDALKFLQPRKALEEDLKMGHALNENEKEDRAVKQARSEDMAYRVANQTVSDFWDNIKINAGGATPQQMSDLVTSIQSGNSNISQEQITQLAYQMRANRSVVYNSIMKQLRLKDKSGMSIADRIGPKRVADITGESMAQYDNVLDSLSKNRLDLVDQSTNFMQAKVGDATKALMANKDIGGSAAAVGALTKINPEFAKDVGMWYLKNTTEWNKGLASYFKDDASRIMSGYDIRKNNGVAKSLNQYLDDLKSGAKTLPKEAQFKLPEVYREYVNLADRISDPRTPDQVKLNIAQTMFDPSNFGVTNKFTDDAVTPEGKVVPGKNAVFMKLTSPGKTTELKRLSSEYPVVWQNYTNWAEREFGQILFRREIANLDQSSKDLENYRIAYKPETHSFYIIPNQQTQDLSSLNRNDFFKSGYETQSYVPYVQKSLDRLNAGISNLSNIAKANGTDIDAYLLGVLAQNGLDIGGGKISGISQKMLDALRLSRQNIQGKENGRVRQGSPTRGSTSEE